MKKLTKVQKSKVDSFSTKSAKIRFLNDLDYTRSQIVKFFKENYSIEIRYQHVRNVLITPITNPQEK